MIRVKATREGHPGKGITSTGWVIDDHVPFAALPSTHAKNKFIRITNPANQLSTLAWIADIGPWNTNDDEYVFGGNRPQAESGTDKSGRATNGAGIDLGEFVWKALKMTDNAEVDWEFVE